MQHEIALCKLSADTDVGFIHRCVIDDDSVTQNEASTGGDVDDDASSLAQPRPQPPAIMFTVRLGLSTTDQVSRLADRLPSATPQHICVAVGPARS